MHKITAPRHLVRYSPAFPNILIILGGGKSSGTDISENYMDQKTQNLAQNYQKCIFWAKFGRFWAINPNSYGITVLQITDVNIT